LWNFSGLKDINPAVLANAADRGTRVHKICEGIILGFGLEPEDDTWGYVQSFKKWWELGHCYIAIEKRFYNDEFMVTGQCDLILQTADGDIIVDFKTSSKESKTWPIQGNAYAYMANRDGYNIKKILFLHLNKHGKPAKEIYYDVDESLFLAHMKIYNHYWGKNGK
jgi:hypothetical protein